MRMILAAVALLASSISAMSVDAIELVVHSAKAGDVFGEILIQIKNNSQRSISKVRYSCGVFNSTNALIGADTGYADNVPSSDSAYTRLLVPIEAGRLKEVSQAKCRVTETR